MSKLRHFWVVGIVAVVVGLVFYLGIVRPPLEPERELAPKYEPKTRDHVDHSPYFTDAFATPQDVTRACLECHPEAATEVMKTQHWTWLGDEVEVPGHPGKQRIGKANLINNFCIAVNAGNYAGCTKCHAGYGWRDKDFDFSRQENVDCLVCHDNTGNYLKGEGGMPAPGVDLLAVAQGVGYPKRENCGYCHNYGGGGLGVKHGDLDNTLDNPSENDDVHMGREKFTCTECHSGGHHNVKGRSMSVSVEDSNNVGCTDCHGEQSHRDERLNAHTKSIACQTCHIPTFARRVPTKTDWDWSKAGDPNRADDVHHYLKIKGEFVYGTEIVPEYHWFNGTSERYLLGDKIDPSKPVDINNPLGDVRDRNARIWPFKVHRAKQPYDLDNKVLVPPRTSGEGGFWHKFDWNEALRLGAQDVGLDYSGHYGFVETIMYWPLSHMVTPKEQALGCDDCHGSQGRLNWKDLGYDQDPIVAGGRP